MTCLLRLKTYVTVHVLLVCTLFGSEAATDNSVPGSLGPNPLAVNLVKTGTHTTVECRAASWWSQARETSGFRVNVVYRTIISLGYSTLPELRLVQSPAWDPAYPYSWTASIYMNTPCHWKQARCVSLFWNPSTDLISNSKVLAHNHHNIHCNLHVSLTWGSPHLQFLKPFICIHRNTYNIIISTAHAN